MAQQMGDEDQRKAERVCGGWGFTGSRGTGVYQPPIYGVGGVLL